MNNAYERDTYDEERESFYNFCMSYTKYNKDEFFEYDSTGHEYLNKNVEAAFQCWNAGFGFGFDKGYEYFYDHTKKDKV